VLVRAEGRTGAQVACGIKPGVTLDGIKAGIETGTLESSLNLLDVAPGEVVFVDAGTVHAILPGSILLETQQKLRPDLPDVRLRAGARAAHSEIS